MKAVEGQHQVVGGRVGDILGPPVTRRRVWQVGESFPRAFDRMQGQVDTFDAAVGERLGDRLDGDTGTAAHVEDPGPVGELVDHTVESQQDHGHQRGSRPRTRHRPPEEPHYDPGGMGFSIRDHEGNIWSFGTYAGPDPD